MLETMQGDFSGFYQGVKEVLKQKEQLGGIRGAVLELIATEQKYETAIEIALAQRRSTLSQTMSRRRGKRFNI